MGKETTRTDATSIQDRLQALDFSGENYATQFIALLLEAGCQEDVSDIHIQPTAAGLDLRWRLDGVLQPLGVFPPGQVADPVSRLKVLAELLTYRHDTPQEGRIRDAPQSVEMRVSTFPTLRGERAVVRLFAATEQPWYLRDVGLSEEIRLAWQQCLQETAGAVVICGPAGSGKTTTAYASLRQIIQDSRGGRSIVTIEDPIEIEVVGAAQSQVNASVGFSLTSGLRSLLRQDPEVILVGEIRDPEAATMAFQAALTGQLVITTFHAISAAAAISRLHDMGIEPYVLRSGIRAVLNQRLVRRLCACKRPAPDDDEYAGWHVTRGWVPVGCERCRGTGYLGRFVLAELLLPRTVGLRREVIAESDANEIEWIAQSHGMVTCSERAIQAIEAGDTSAAEARRVLGFEVT